MELPTTLLFYGPSGSGKGTQIQNTIELYLSLGKKVKVFAMGDSLREFASLDKQMSHYVDDILKKGELAPMFMAVWLWSNFFMKEVMEGDVIILDGVGRRQSELEIFVELLKSLDRHCTIIALDVPFEVCKERMYSRARADDDTEKMERRLKWYENDTKMALEYAKNSPVFTVNHINGTLSIEEVFRQIAAILAPES